MTEEYTPKTFTPSSSIPIKTNAKLLAEGKWTIRDKDWMRFAVYQTRGGSYICVTEGNAPGKANQVKRDVAVIEPIYSSATSMIDETAMQIAVLDFWGWHDRAKAMLKGELGWAPVREVA